MTNGNKAEHHEGIRGSVGHYGLSSSELELKTPLPLHFDHTHSIYVAVGTLVSAVIVVIIAVISNKKKEYFASLQRNSINACIFFIFIFLI